MRRIQWLGFGFALSIAGCETKPPDPGATQPQPTITTPSIKLGADHGNSLNGPGNVQFDINQLRSLELRLQVPTFPAGQVTWVTMELYTPSGALFQSLHLPYAADPTLKEVPSPDGVPHPIDVIQATPIPGGLGLDLELHVAGTELYARPLPGVWKVSMAVDGQPSLRADATFMLGMGQ